MRLRTHLIPYQPQHIEVDTPDHQLLQQLGGEISQVFSVEEPEMVSFDGFRQWLSSQVRFWIWHDLETLVRLLYRIDVAEEKLRNTLAMYPEEDAATQIADMIIERQLQKIKSRQQFGGRDQGISTEEERW